MENIRDCGLFRGGFVRLSGGEKKLAAIADVLAMGAETLLLDEPSAAVFPF